ncbi:MAG TPA: hypothetical protein VMF06_14490 [Candidatus Limnocylindria bacterium]|nr:hypothetical protein [Candidatus Limnocylindria bacterium]
MSCNGAKTDIRAGSWPIVLRKSHRILYQDPDDHAWHTCDFDGKSPNLYADGLKDFSSPAISPDESQIVFIRRQIGQWPEVFLFDFGSSTGKMVRTVEEFEGIPIWR